MLTSAPNHLSNLTVKQERPLLLHQQYPDNDENNFSVLAKAIGAVKSTIASSMKAI